MTKGGTKNSFPSCEKPSEQEAKLCGWVSAEDQEKAYRDLVMHGQAFRQGGKHVPVCDVYIDRASEVLDRTQNQRHRNIGRDPHSR